MKTSWWWILRREVRRWERGGEDGGWVDWEEGFDGWVDVDDRIV